MSANRSAKGSGTNTFETYRQIAPESLDDQALRELIKRNNNDHAAISVAIENIWHDIPDQKAVGSDWVTTSKSKKDVLPPKGAPRRTEGGRGSAGRGGGRGAPAGGRGGADGRGERGGRGSKPSSRASPARTTPSPTAAAAGAEEAAAEEESDVEEEPAVVAAPAPAPAPVAAAPVSAAVAAPAGPAWGKGPSFAEKLKRAEAEKARAAAQPKETAQAAPAPAAAAAVSAPAGTAAPAEGDAAEGIKGRSRGPRRARGASASGKKGEESAVGDLAEATAALSVAAEPVEEAAAPVPAPVVEAPAPVEAAPTVSEGFLKMGKWEAPVEAADMSTFQFGSFGSAYDNTNGVSASQVGTNPSAAPWTGLHTEEKAATNVWGAPAEPSLDMSSGLFAQQSTATADVSLSSSAAATRAPPGLAPKNNNKATNKPKVDAPQAAPAAQTPAQNAAYAQPYSQAPGMNRTGLPAAPYPYTAPFDLSQQQFGGYPLPGAPPVAAAASTPATATTAQSSASTASTNSAQAAQPPQQQQQQPYPAGAFQFFNPYYPGQYYYGQPQMANYYGQGRDMYNQRGPYGANPYGNAGSLYPDVYGQQVAGQFPDASGNYMHQMQNAGAAGANNAAPNANKGNKNPAPGNNAAAAAAPQQGMTPEQQASMLMSSGYGYVNPYAGRGAMDGQGWQGYPAAQAAWGAPMMPFPANPSPTNLAAAPGFPQQAGAAPGQGQNQGQQGNRNSYGGRGNAGANGASLPSGGQAAQGAW